mmetsp:Transcript_4896/g.5920  ORF Transcript_4896/g.5920 Transcript_4896/m.5920 type:complete len:99 (-) Transcript_4896:114-410(-)
MQTSGSPSSSCGCTDLDRSSNQINYMNHHMSDNQSSTLCISFQLISLELLEPGSLADSSLELTLFPITSKNTGSMSMCEVGVCSQHAESQFMEPLHWC